MEAPQLREVGGVNLFLTTLPQANCASKAVLIANGRALAESSSSSNIVYVVKHRLQNGNSTINVLCLLNKEQKANGKKEKKNYSMEMVNAKGFYLLLYQIAPRNISLSPLEAN